MIFVTVGTHEQPFNRLVEYMDKWAAEHDEEVIMQTGFSTYEPKHCEWSKLYPYSQMVELVEKARIVITHGGPSSFIMPLQIGKVPIVVPRKKEYDEHVNDHQVEFSKAVAERLRNIIVVNSISKLGNFISSFDAIVVSMSTVLHSNNERFNEKLEKIVANMFEEK